MIVIGIEYAYRFYNRAVSLKRMADTTASPVTFLAVILSRQQETAVSLFFALAPLLQELHRCQSAAIAIFRRHGVLASQPFLSRHTLIISAAERQAIVLDT